MLVFKVYIGATARWLCYSTRRSYTPIATRQRLGPSSVEGELWWRKAVNVPWTYIFFSCFLLLGENVPEKRNFSSVKRDEKSVTDLLDYTFVFLLREHWKISGIMVSVLLTSLEAICRMVDGGDVNQQVGAIFFDEKRSVSDHLRMQVTLAVRQQCSLLLRTKKRP